MNKIKGSKNAIILCSGGVDSVVTSYYAKKKLGYKRMILLFFDYGQRTLRQERVCSKKTARDLNAEFIEINLKQLGEISTSLINSSKRVRRIKRKGLKNTKKESERYYVPCRNSVFLVYAMALAESLGIKSREEWNIFVGFKNEGREPYPDTTAEFVREMNSLSKIGCIKKIKIFAPLIRKDKEDIINLGKKIGVNFRDTFSCYASKSRRHCGNCLACMLRKEGFYWSGIKDPAYYESG